ncbi:hypothetical protein [Paenibacillus methanolicus]|uniref:Lipoprotein n=1 Tax=Paenibacillus methanolicus TaxID=582686 RepID=A0A5S5CGZ1_9BACL|nr:hypothetical protein [Paenibacillus methanolicus]TYP77772.1 hypothetical protein BCM02_102337 [Paenibacillus methanolicus]
MNRWRSSRLAAVMVVMAVLLSGCLYPDEERAASQLPAKDEVMNVQTVIDQYQKDTGLLPIMNSEPNTPVYEKYLIDFGKLTRMKYLSDIPPAAFEKGGNYYFLIINEETDPTVKLMNLAVYQQVNDVQREVSSYQRTKGALPRGEEVYPGYYRIDYSALNVREPKLVSIFTGQTQQTMMDAGGNVYVDYTADMMQAIQKSGESPSPDQDLRELLASRSDFVPVKSPAYRFINNEPKPVAAK